MRRMRRTKTLRDLIRETDLSPAHLVQPLFVVAGEGVREPVPSMPGVERFSISELVGEAGEIAASGVRAVILFGIPASKDEMASGAYDDEGVVQMAVRALKEAHPDLLVITDVCLCEYTSHGHCGVVREDGEVDNDVTVELIAKTAISHVEAGADMVAPSDMMDGRVGAIRSQLDELGHTPLPIVAYSAKYASAFYGPFREAAESTPEFGDRRGYQMDPANAAEGVREALLDLEEGADVLMVKPALPYLDVVRRVKEETGAPVAAFQVSGEYSMLKAAADAGWIDERAAVLEALTSIRRAGADIVVTYFAKRAAGWL
jgi:porphobilinogen synthase